MRIKVKSPLIMFLFGWGEFPEYVVADHKLWLRWLRLGRPGKRRL